MTVSELIEKKRVEVRSWCNEWLCLRHEMEKLLLEANVSADPQVHESAEQLKGALMVFEAELARPTITLATTGTTSGGKSSLVNLLCGAEIMPVAVQEMSAGIVTINHSSGLR